MLFILFIISFSRSGTFALSFTFKAPSVNSAVTRVAFIKQQRKVILKLGFRGRPGGGDGVVGTGLDGDESTATSTGGQAVEDRVGAQHCGIE